MRTELWKDSLRSGKVDGALTALYGTGPEAPRARYLTLVEEFEAAYGPMDTAIISAPGRTELAGNHTDHQNGIVLCAAVTKDAVAVAAPAEDNTVRILSRGFGEICLTLDTLAPRPEEYGTSEGIIRGVAAGLDSMGIKAGGLRVAVDSQVPAGGGLSSSAAFEVLMGAIFSHFYGNDAADALTLAKIGQGAERDYFGKPSGLMDQAASACGGITMIDFGDPTETKVDRIAFDFRKNGYVLCAVDTRTSHADLTGDYASIPAEMRSVAEAMGQELLRYVNYEDFMTPETHARLERGLLSRAILRAEHFFAENARVPHMAEALRQRDMGAYVRLMNQSGRSSREKLQNVVPSLHPEMTEMAEALDRAGALLSGRGAWRIHGGGFAGCIQCLVPEADYEDFQAKMDEYYGQGACFELRIRPCGVNILAE